MRILGVDPATSKPLGVALVTPRLTVEYGGLCGYMDLWDILDTYNPDIAVIEDQFFFKNFATAKKLAWSAGKIMGICALHRTVNCTMNVSHWKKIMECLTKGDKEAHIRRARQIFGQDFQDDVASAVLIATAYLKEYQILDKDIPPVIK